MKRLLAILLCVLALTAASVPAGAQTRGGRRYYDAATRQRTYDYDRYGSRSIWDKHRDKITTAGGALGGAAIGGLAGGKKGALIGAIAGGAGAALYTYKLRKKGRPY